MSHKRQRDPQPAMWIAGGALLLLILSATGVRGQTGLPFSPQTLPEDRPDSRSEEQYRGASSDKRLSLAERLRLFHQKRKQGVSAGRSPHHQASYTAHPSFAAAASRTTKKVKVTSAPDGPEGASSAYRDRAVTPTSAYTSYRRNWSSYGPSSSARISAVPGPEASGGQPGMRNVETPPAYEAASSYSPDMGRGLSTPARHNGGPSPVSPGYSADVEGWSASGQRNRLQSGTGTPGAAFSPALPPGKSLTPTHYQPQTPGEIPELLPEEKPPEHIFLPEAPQSTAEKSWWRRFRETVQTTPPLVKQKLYGAGTWVWGGKDDVGFYDVFVQGTFASMWWRGFSVSPMFQVHFLDGPTRTDLPPQLYSTRVELRWQKQLNERWGMDLSVAPGVYSDFEQGDADAFRIMGRALGVYQWSVYSQFVLGVVYLDREDVRVIPAVGWIYTPRDDLRLEFLFPRPKIAVRFSQQEHFSRWGYLLGEFGGGSWSVERRNGQQDIVSYSDLRLLFGFEQRYVNGRSLLLEIGVVFDREIEFKSDNGDFDPSTTGLLRTGIVY